MFKETTNVRFEGNNYSEDWVVEAKRRGLPNVRSTPEALAQLVAKQSRELFNSLAILSKEELDSRYHVRLERYAKDMLIEMHTMAEMIDTMVLPGGYAYVGMLADASAKAKAAGITVVPQVAAANEVGKLIAQLRKSTAALHAALGKAESLHQDAERQARFLTASGADAMAAVRLASDALELAIGDEYWPLPRYREMLFPV